MGFDFDVFDCDEDELEQRMDELIRLRDLPRHEAAILNPARYFQLQEAAEMLKNIVASENRSCSIKIEMEPNWGYGRLEIKVPDLVVRDMQAFYGAIKDANIDANIMVIDSREDGMMQVELMFYDMFQYPE